MVLHVAWKTKVCLFITLLTYNNYLASSLSLSLMLNKAKYWILGGQNELRLESHWVTECCLLKSVCSQSIIEFLFTLWDVKSRIYIYNLGSHSLINHFIIIITWILNTFQLTLLIIYLTIYLFSSKYFRIISIVEWHKFSDISDLFTIYIDTLLQRLKHAGICYFVGCTYAGAFGHADDLACLAPSLNSIWRIIYICENYAKDFNILFNPGKSSHVRICQHIQYHVLSCVVK